MIYRHISSVKKWGTAGEREGVHRFSGRFLLWEGEGGGEIEGGSRGKGLFNLEQKPPSCCFSQDGRVHTTREEKNRNDYLGDKLRMSIRAVIPPKGTLKIKALKEEGCCDVPSRKSGHTVYRPKSGSLTRETKKRKIMERGKKMGGGGLANSMRMGTSTCNF